MSIRLDPRRLGTLKQLAAEEGVRPGDLVRGWVEERIDAARGGAPIAAPANLAKRLDELTERVAALEGATPARAKKAPTAAADEAEPPAPTDVPAIVPEPDASEAPPPRKRTRRATAAPSERVGLHDEIMAVIRERGPQTSAELAQAISERGRYAPPRSGKALDAAMVSQRVSNPTYRSRFVRADGRIGLAEVEGT